MSPLAITLLVIVIILIAVLAALIIFGRKAQRQQAVQQEQIEAMAQTISMLVIDKKRMRLNQSGLPPQVIQQTPKLLRRSRLPIVKAKVGPKIMTMVCDEKIFELLPIKREVKVVVSGIYISAIKSARGGLETPPPKKGFFKRLFKK